MLLQFDGEGAFMQSEPGLSGGTAHDDNSRDNRDHYIFRGLPPRIVDAVLKSFALVTDCVPPAVAKSITPAEIQFFIGLELLG